MHEAWRAMYTLVYEYVPFLFGLGKRVRDCSWAHRDAGTGIKAKSILVDCTICLLALRANLTGQRQ